MAKTEKQKSESYADRMNVQEVDISEVVPLLKKCYHLRRSFIPLLVGHAGIGKTDSLIEAGKQLSKELDKSFRVQVSLTSSKLPEDYGGIPIPVHKDKQIVYYLMDELPLDGCGILCFDELNRCDQETLKPVINFFSSFTIRDYTLPEGWAIMAAMNPDESLYNVVRSEPALRRRLAIVEVTTSPASWLLWAEKNKVHPAVCNYIKKNKDVLLNISALENDKVFANPSAWKKISDLLFTVNKSNVFTYKSLIAGCVGNEFSRGVINEFLDTSMDIIDPDLVLYNFESVRPLLEEHINKGNIEVINSLIGSVKTALEVAIKKTPNIFEQSKDSTIISNIALFYEMLPNDLAVVFGQSLNNVGKIVDKLTKHPASRKKLLSINLLIKTQEEKVGS